VKLADSRYRGYARVEATQSRIVTDLRGMDTIKERESACNTIASFVVEDGRPGAKKA
jgi:alkaline phosphatase D